MVFRHIFSFFHNVPRHITRAEFIWLSVTAPDLNQSTFFLCSKEIKDIDTFPNKPWYLHVWSKSTCLKTLWEKEKLLVTSNFYFQHSVSTHLENFMPFSTNLKLLSATFSAWKSLEFVVWERVRENLILHLSL